MHWVEIVMTVFVMFMFYSVSAASMLLCWGQHKFWGKLIKIYVWPAAFIWKGYVKFIDWCLTKKRRKNHLAEFTEYGFAIHVHFDLKVRDWHELFDDFVDITERYHWCTAGGIDPENGTLSQVICENRYSSSMHDNQRAYCEEVLALPGVIRVEVWPIIDAWNASEEEHLRHKYEPDSYAFYLEKE